MKEVVLDIETIGDIKNFGTIKITVVSIYEYERDAYRSFEESELGDLWPVLEKADRLIGYNSEHFDLPIMNKYYTGDLTQFPHLDLLKQIKLASGKRYKLNDVAKATLQIEKSADGLRAQEWFRQGKIEKIKKYCEQDVLVTKELYDYGKKNKMIYFPTLTGEVVPISINFEPPPVPLNSQGEDSNSINLTLPI